MGKIESHRDLKVWQKAMDLATEVYRLVQGFPRSETYGMCSQLTRAVVSVPANIAEGQARYGSRSYAHFVSTAKGSLMEVETVLTIAQRLGYVSMDQLEVVYSLITEISKMLTSLRNRLRRRGDDDLPPREP